MKQVGRWVIAMILVAGSVGVTVGAQPSATEQRVRQQLIGTYKLISYTSFDQNGVATKLPYSAGQIAYDAAGRMSAQLMRADRPPFTGGRGGSEPERAAAYSSYIAYFGHYTIDAEKGIVYHHVEGSMTPSMVGQAMPRYYELTPDGATLFLQTKSGDRVTGRLQWDRYK